MGEATEMMMMIMLIGGGYYLYANGYLDSLLKPAQAPAPVAAPAPAPSGGGRGGGGRGSAPAAAPAPAAGGGGGAAPNASTGAGDCSKTIYTATGQKVDNSKRTKQGTRHYASGKADDVTSEWSTSCNFKNYEFTAYFTITKVDHDDTVSFKFGGTHMGTGWFDCGISFNGGQTCIGSEKSHPSTSLCTVKGKSFGKIVGKKVGLKCILFGAGTSATKIEVWCDPAANGQWQLGCKSDNGSGGWSPKSGKQETCVRIDGAPGITMHCGAIQEIQPGGTAKPGGAAPPAATKTIAGSGEPGGSGAGIKPDEAPAKSKYARSYRVSYY